MTALTIFVFMENKEYVRIAEEKALEEAAETEPRREVTKTAVINIAADEGGFSGHVEGDYYVIDYCSLDEEIINVPDSIDNYPVKKLGKLSFARRFCKQVNLPDSVEEIGERAFINCEDLESISFGNGLKKIGPEALMSCHLLKEVSFPEGMAEIADLVFRENEELIRINIPGNGTKTGIILETDTCPKAVTVTPAGSEADKTARENSIPVQNE